MKKIFTIVFAILFAVSCVLPISLGTAWLVKQVNMQKKYEQELAAYEDARAAYDRLKAENRVAASLIEEGENIVFIDIENYGVLAVELNPNEAPITVANFKKLAGEGFYDNLTFHRIIEGFMIQGGDPKGDGSGGSAETIKGEFTANGILNNISHERGTISMARSEKYNSASSQFFIVHENYFSLDGKYAAFGKVVAGITIVDAIAAVDTDAKDAPRTPVVMRTVTQDKDKLITVPETFDLEMPTDPETFTITWRAYLLATLSFLPVIAFAIPFVLFLVLFLVAQKRRKAEELRKAEAARAAARAEAAARRKKNKKKK